MRLTISRRAPLFVVLCTIALTAAMTGQAQTAHSDSPPPAAPTSPNSPPKVMPPNELQWSKVGATAQCQDGTFFHGKLDAHSCADHGGVWKWLQARGQDLIR